MFPRLRRFRKSTPLMWYLYIYNEVSSQSWSAIPLLNKIEIWLFEALIITASKYRVFAFELVRLTHLSSTDNGYERQPFSSPFHDVSPSNTSNPLNTKHQPSYPLPSEERIVLIPTRLFLSEMKSGVYFPMPNRSCLFCYFLPHFLEAGGIM